MDMLCFFGRTQAKRNGPGSSLVLDFVFRSNPSRVNLSHELASLGSI